MPDIFTLGPTLLGFSEEAGKAAEGGGHHTPNWLGWFVYTLFVLVLVFFMLGKAKSGINNRVFTNWWTQRLEQLYLFLENMCVGIIGPHGRKYMPMMMTFWLVIFVANVVALLFPYAPTADLSFNLGMALIAVGYVQWEGMRANGVIGHFSHFAGPKFGIKGAAIVMTLLITPLIFSIEIVSELMKNVSLSLRLFGNIHGGHEAVVALNNLGGSFVPVGFFLLPIKFLTCIVQALIFTLLTCVYLSLVTHHEDHGDHGHGEAAHAH